MRAEPATVSFHVPDDIRELVTDNGRFELPPVADAAGEVRVVRLRAYLGRLEQVVSGQSADGDQWLSAYNWAVAEERKLLRSQEGT
jgi:hypothetical protein